MIAMFGWLSDARTFASRLEAGDSFRVCRERLGQDLDGDIAIELRVAGSVHLAHAPFADLRGDFVNAEACAGGEGHSLRDYTGGAAARTGLLLTDAVVFTNTLRASAVILST